jgi:hypothetical protein
MSLFIEFILKIVLRRPGFQKTLPAGGPAGINI